MTTLELATRKAPRTFKVVYEDGLALLVEAFNKEHALLSGKELYPDSPVVNALQEGYW